MSRINEKIEEIEGYLTELEEFIPLNFEEYKNNLEKRRFCEREAEIIIEALVDLAFLVIKEKKLKSPETDDEAFAILNKENIITLGLSNKLKEAKGMRNIIAHEYGRVEDLLLFKALSNQIMPDSEEFIKSIRLSLK